MPRKKGKGKASLPTPPPAAVEAIEPKMEAAAAVKEETVAVAAVKEETVVVAAVEPEATVADEDEDMQLEENTSTALAVSTGTAIAAPLRSDVPPGVRIKWFQRKETLTLEIEVPNCEDPEVTWTDEGTISLTAKDPRHHVSLQLLRRIHTGKSRWYHAGRVIKLELWKAEYGLGHWDKLLVGEKLSNVLIDWTSWIDEAEEAEIRANPYGHDAHHMAGAMGAHWGSNVERTIKAKTQAAKVNTSKPDDPEDDITCF